jgi:hypothetical protein
MQEPMLIVPAGFLQLHMAADSTRSVDDTTSTNQQHKVGCFNRCLGNVCLNNILLRLTGGADWTPQQDHRINIRDSK